MNLLKLVTMSCPMIGAIKTTPEAHVEDARALPAASLVQCCAEHDKQERRQQKQQQPSNRAVNERSRKKIAQKTKHLFKNILQEHEFLPSDDEDLNEL